MQVMNVTFEDIAADPVASVLYFLSIIYFERVIACVHYSTRVFDVFIQATKGNIDHSKTLE
jgi:hypothetical protein